MIKAAGNGDAPKLAAFLCHSFFNYLPPFFAFFD